MKHSPLIYSATIIASMTLLGGTAWSYAASQEKSKTATILKAKTPQSKPPKTTIKQDIAIKAPPVTAATKVIDTPVAVPPAAIVAIVPASPTAPLALAPARSLAAAPAIKAAEIQPKLINPYLVNSGISFPPTIAPTASAPVLPVPVLSTPAPTNIPAVAATLQAAPDKPYVSQFVPPLSLPTAFVSPFSAPNAAPTAAPLAAYQPLNTTPAAHNPYLAYQYQPSTPVSSVKPVVADNPFTANPFAGFPDVQKLISLTPPQYGNTMPSNANVPVQAAFPKASTPAAASSNSIFSGLSLANLKMMLPLTGDSNILPSIKKVYPTGEKPLVVINFKCPTELVGITPPPIMLLREAMDLGFGGLNKSNLLSFDLQQVCS